MQPKLIEITFTGRWPGDEDDNPYINLDRPEDAIRHLRNANEIVINSNEIRILYDYPLRKPVIFTESALNGVNFTRVDLARVICTRYVKIYEEPEDLWGHSLDDLLLHSVKQTDTGVYVLGIDS
jgi:hypothetical protein